MNKKNKICVIIYFLSFFFLININAQEFGDIENELLFHSDIRFNKTFDTLIIDVESNLPFINNGILVMPCKTATCKIEYVNNYCPEESILYKKIVEDYIRVHSVSITNNDFLVTDDKFTCPSICLNYIDIENLGFNNNYIDCSKSSWNFKKKKLFIETNVVEIDYNFNNKVINKLNEDILDYSVDLLYDDKIIKQDIDLNELKILGLKGELLNYSVKIYSEKYKDKFIRIKDMKRDASISLIAKDYEVELSFFIDESKYNYKNPIKNKKKIRVSSIEKFETMKLIEDTSKIIINKRWISYKDIINRKKFKVEISPRIIEKEFNLNITGYGKQQPIIYINESPILKDDMGKTNTSKDGKILIRTVEGINNAIEIIQPFGYVFEGFDNQNSIVINSNNLEERGLKVNKLPDYNVLYINNGEEISNKEELKITIDEIIDEIEKQNEEFIYCYADGRDSKIYTRAFNVSSRSYKFDAAYPYYIDDINEILERFPKEKVKRSNINIYMFLAGNHFTQRTLSKNIRLLKDKFNVGRNKCTVKLYYTSEIRNIELIENYKVNIIR